MSSAGSSQEHPLNFGSVSDSDEPSTESPTAHGAFPESPLDEAQTIISSGPPLLLPLDQRALAPGDLGKKLEGERLGHFKLEEFIGGGGMGVVFRALDTMLNRTVAVKVLSSEHASDEETQRRFKNEAQSAARLDHDNIARVYYVGEDRGVHYIVFEHIEGINIRDLVEQHGPLSLGDAVSFGLQIAEALTHASERDVVHRDIKPSNVIVTPEGRAKLVDMGLARLYQVERTENDLTASGVTLGTFDYISPEQAREPRMADVRSDLYSLGCTLFFMLTGRPPFPDGNMMQKLLRHQGDAPPNTREMRSDVPAELSQIVSKLLAKLPEDRYQSPVDLIDDLLRLSEQYHLLASGIAAATASALARSERHQRSRRRAAIVRRHVPWVVPACALVAIALWSDYSEPVQPQVAWPPLQTLPAEAPAERTVSPTIPPAQSAGDTINSADETPSAAPGAKIEGGETSLDTPASTDGVNASLKTTPLAPLEADIQASNPIAERLEQRPGFGVRQEDGKSRASAVDSTSVGLAASSPAVDDRLVRTESVNSVTLPPADPLENPPRAGILVVMPDGPPEAFSTLRAACGEAKSGNIIELHFNGTLVERPLTLANHRLTIRAGDGFRPRVVFRPGPEDNDPLSYPRQMIGVIGGELKLVNLEVELDLRLAAPAESWVLIEARGAESLRVTQCVLTIRNSSDGQQLARHQGVAFCDAVAPTGSDTMAMDDDIMPLLPLDVRLEHVVARGEADLLRSVHMQPIRFTWYNGLLATSEHLARLGAQMAPRPSSELVLDLSHVTANVRQGLVLASNHEDAPYPLDISIQSSNNIIMAGPDAALIDQRGVDAARRLQEMVQWSGDRNFYEGFRTFWNIQEDLAAEPLVRMDLTQWQQHWGTRADLPRSGAVVWKNLPPQDKPFSAQTAADYALSDRAENNPARGGASDLGDVGFRAERLPLVESRADANASAPPEPPE